MAPRSFENVAGVGRKRPPASGSSSLSLEARLGGRRRRQNFRSFNCVFAGARGRRAKGGELKRGLRSPADGLVTLVFGQTFEMLPLPLFCHLFGFCQEARSVRRYTVYSTSALVTALLVP